MAGETQITVVGNLTGDPELRFTPNGAAVANFTIASTPRKFDSSTQEWADGDTLFMRSSVWRDYAENVAETLTKGMRVIATGNLVQRNYEDKDGNNRTSYELEVDEVGPALRYATADVTRTESKGGNGNSGGKPRSRRSNDNDDADEAPAKSTRRRASRDDDDEDEAPKSRSTRGRGRSSRNDEDDEF